MFGNKRAYLDTAAGFSGNPSSPHEEGRMAHARLESARTRIARLVEAKADDVIFTSGATEANALAILGLARGLREKGRGPFHFLYLPSAHASVVENMKALQREGVEAEPLPIAGYRVDIDRLQKMLGPETALVSMDAVCGETGIVWNTREVASALEKAGGHALLHVDASQAPLTERITRAHFGADLVTLDASKVGALRGAGALIARRAIPLAPLYRGGGQERGLRPGTEAVEAALAFARALEEAVARQESFRALATAERARLLSLIRAKLPAALINGGEEHALPSVRQAPHILNISLPGADTDYIVALLDEAGFAISTRSACETDSTEGSRAVYALTGDALRAASTLRVSWNPGTAPRTLSRFAAALAKAAAFVDRGSLG